MCCIHSSNAYGKMFLCIPVALFVLIASCLLGAWSGVEIWSIVSDHLETGQKYNFSSGLGLALACFRGLAAIFGIVAVIFRQAWGLSILRMGFKMLLTVSIITFIIQWVFWILWLAGVQTAGGVPLNGGKWKPDKSEIIYMVVFCVLNVLLFVLAYWILSAMKSLQFIFGVGGTGWEGKSYTEIKESQKESALQEENYEMA